MTKRLAVSIAAILTLTHLAMDKALATDVKKTTGKQAKWLSDSLAKHASIVAWAQGVRVTSDGYFVNSKDGRKNFVLKPGDKLKSTDKHLSVTLVFLETINESARFEYEATFDSRSFGTNRLEIDSGVLAIAIQPLVPPKSDEPTNHFYLDKIKKKLSASGCQLISCKNESFRDENFLSAVFFTGDSRGGSQNSPRISTMIKVCKTEADSKAAFDRLLKLWNGGKRIPDDYFEDHYYFPVGAYVGKFEMLRKRRVLFIIWFSSPTDRTLLQEACRECLIDKKS